MINQNKMTAVEFLEKELYERFHLSYLVLFNELIQQAKEMEKEQKQRFNKFLNDEMELGISDKKTIERIQWYYNNYLSTFKSE